MTRLKKYIVNCQEKNVTSVKLSQNSLASRIIYFITFIINLALLYSSKQKKIL